MTDTTEQTALQIMEGFLLNWDIEDYSTQYTCERMVEELERAGFKIVAVGEQGDAK